MASIKIVDLFMIESMVILIWILKLRYSFYFFLWKVKVIKVATFFIIKSQNPMKKLLVIKRLRTFM